MLAPLPIDVVLPTLVDGLRRCESIVLKAPAGAGKTTRVPPAILDAGLAERGRILVLQPRRVAARAAARRIAFERGVRLGEEVGYQVRFDERVSARTRINVVTEGILLRMLHDQPFLDDVAVVVFDEFHERSLNSDLALGMAWRLQQSVRPELKLVVMSATLAAQPISDYLGGCPIVESEGRTFPVAVSYLPQPDKRPLAAVVAGAVERMLDRTTGDVLVFLPGVGEIRQASRELQTLARRDNLAVMELFGDLPAEQQDQVLLPCERRKVVLSTNVAETSVTIEGITGVIDTGLARVLRFDSHVGLDRLELSPICRASADQRAGRAGRTQPGVCLRLWDARSHTARPEFEEPEIRRVDLAAAVLQLWNWGERDVLQFPWFEPPRPAAVEQAIALLKRLEAVTDHGVTELGRRIVRFPVHPRIGRLLLEGQRLGCAEQAALAAAMLSERDPFLRPGTEPRSGPPPTIRPRRSNSDLLDRVQSLAEFARTGRLQTEVGMVNEGAARFVFRARDQLLELLAARRTETPASGDGILRALLAAFPDRLARRREPRSPKALMVGGRGVRLSPQSAVIDHELFLCIDVDAGDTEALVRQASAVERDWLPPELLNERDELFFHPSQARVAARRRTYWDDLVIEDNHLAVPLNAAAAQCLAEAAAKQWDRIFPADDSQLSNFLHRVRCLAAWLPALNLPSLDERHIKDLLPQLCHGRTSFDELRKAPWLDYVRAELTPPQLQAVDREAPERLSVPSGSQIRLQYEEGRPPVLAIRIQEVFGLQATPRIAGGRVPVLLHLLAPNMRPQQVTDDLTSFWANTYPKIRSELRRRYPKHAWPEDPLTAPPQSRPGKKGGD